MAYALLEGWGVKRCQDFGDIVFHLVDYGVLGKTEHDRREDFAGGYHALLVGKANGFSGADGRVGGFEARDADADSGADEPGYKGTSLIRRFALAHMFRAHADADRVSQSPVNARDVLYSFHLPGRLNGSGIFKDMSDAAMSG